MCDIHGKLLFKDECAKHRLITNYEGWLQEIHVLFVAYSQYYNVFQGIL